MNKLRSETAYRLDEISNLFERETFGVTPSLAEDQTSLYLGTKSEVKKQLKIFPPTDVDMQKSAIIIELSPVVLAKKAVNNFNDFAVLNLAFTRGRGYIINYLFLTQVHQRLN